MPLSVILTHFWSQENIFFTSIKSFYHSPFIVRILGSYFFVSTLLFTSHFVTYLICHFSQKDWESTFVDYTGF